MWTGRILRLIAGNAHLVSSAPPMRLIRLKKFNRALQVNIALQAHLQVQSAQLGFIVRKEQTCQYLAQEATMETPKASRTLGALVLVYQGITATW
jgi:hypothetical protein